ncbi:MAG: HpcH/HpaI aldolase family protein [Thermomicrobiales bacterium]
MRPNRVKRALRDGGVAFGTMVFEFGTTGIGQIAAAAGADFAIFDMEHTGWSIETIRSLMATCRAVALVPMVRVPAIEYHLLSRPLDVGAMGLMAPMVESAEQARLMVWSAKYPPVGRRGAAFAVAHDDYAGGDVLTKMTIANEEVMLIAQIETAAGLDQVERVAAVDGIDVVWIGHWDLTVSLGISGKFDHPTYLAAVERIVAAAEAHGKAAGFMVTGVETGADLLAQGYRCLAYSRDSRIYHDALKQGLDGLREAAETLASRMPAPGRGLTRRGSS